MNKSKRRSWVRSTFQIKGSVLPVILERSLLLGGFGLVISILYSLGFPVSQPVLGNVIPSIVLALLLVFRTNTAYERYWEGRKLWGSLVNTIRNLAWQIWTAVEEIEQGDRETKIAALRLLPALIIAKKLYLRDEPPDTQLEYWLSRSQYQKLQNIRNVPLEIAHWLGEYLQQEFKRNSLNNYQLTGIQTLLYDYLNAVGGCERIKKTPIPLAYSIHLKQLVFIYCLILPFQFVNNLGLWTGLFVAFISFTLFGIEEIGIEIENPFGYDPNDLPLDAICRTIERDIEEFINNQN